MGESELPELNEEHVGWGCSSPSMGDHRRFHTDPDCQYLRRMDRVNRVSESQAEFRNLTECKACDDTEASVAEKISNEYETKTCDFCGGEYRVYAKHLRKCEGVTA